MHTTNKPAALVAALPPLIFGLGVTLMLLVIVPLGQLRLGAPSPPLFLASSALRLNLGFAFAAVAALALVVGGVWGAVKKLPAWSPPWVGAGLWGAFFTLMAFSDDRAYLISPLVDGLLLAALLLLGLAALSALAWRGWVPAGAMSLGMTAMLGLLACFWLAASPFNRYDLALLSVLVGALMSALLYAYMRAGDQARLLALLGVGLLNAGVLYTAELVWQTWDRPGQPYTVFWAALAFSTAMLFSGPLLALALRPIRRRWGEGA